MKKNVYIAVAAMMMMGVAGTANAAWTADTTGAKVAFQLTAKTSQVLTGATVTFTEGLIPTGGRYILRLTNGAKFVANPTAVPAAGTATILGSAVGASVATFSVTAGATLGAITITPGNINLSAVPAGGIVDITYESTDNLGNPITAATSLDAAGANAAASAPIFTMVDAAKGVVTTAATNIADVVKGFKNHTAASGVENGATTTLTITAPGDAALVVANDGALITLTGNFAGIGSVSSTGITSATAAGSLAGTTTGFFKIDQAAGKAYAAVTAASVSGTVNPVFVWDGVTAQSARGFTAQVDGLAGTTPTLTYPYVALAPTTIYSTSRNGTSYQLNLVTGSDQLLITNNDGTSAAVAFVAHDAAGAVIAAAPAAGTPALATTVASGATLTVLGSTLLANYAGLATLDVNIEAADVNSQVVHIVPTVGASTTVLRTGGNNAL